MTTASEEALAATSDQQPSLKEASSSIANDCPDNGPMNEMANRENKPLTEADVKGDIMESTTADSAQGNDATKTTDVTTPDNAQPPATATDASATASSSSGFFSRMQSLRSNAAPILGDVYERAQKRAVQLREQAAMEVERLRQQKEQQQQQEEFVIPPSTGTLVVAPHGDSGGAIMSAESSLVSDGAKSDLEERDATKKEVDQSNSNSNSNSNRNNNNRQDSKINHKAITSPVRSAFAIVRQTSVEVAKDLLLPPAVSYSYESTEDGGQDVEGSRSSDSNSVASSQSQQPKNNDNDDADRTEDDVDTPDDETPEDGSSANNNNNNNTTSSSSNIGGMRSKAAAATSAVVSAYTEFRTVGRYRMMKDNEPPQNVATSHDPNDSTQQQQDGEEQHEPYETSVPMVGGADRVGGLRNLKLGDVFSMMNVGGGGRASSSNSVDEDVQSATVDNEDQQQQQQQQQPGEDGASASATTDTGASDASSTTAPTAPAISAKKEQAKPRASHYEEVVRSILQPGQRALFFGKGTMGVILKPTYLASWRGRDGGGLVSPTAGATSTKKGGVFIDYLIPGGHAEKSGVVFVGDHVLKIGGVDVSNMTLEEVVKVINETKRPNIMVLTAEHEVEVVSVPKPEDGNSVEDVPAKQCFTSSLDLAFGFVNKIAAEGVDLGLDRSKGENGRELKAAISRNSLLDDDDESDDDQDIDDEDDDSSEEEIVLFNASGEEEEIDSCGIDDSSGIPDSTDKDKNQEDSSTSSKNESQTSNNSKCEPETDECAHENGASNNDNLPDESLVPNPEIEVIPDETATPPSFPSRENVSTLALYASHRTNGHKIGDQLTSESSNSIPLLLERAALLNPDFRKTLQTAFAECCADPRRCKFLEIWAGRKCQQSNVDENDISSSKTQRKLLELYLELCKFRDAVSVCSVSDREKLLDFAQKISTRFLFDDEDVDRNNETLPEHVVYHALGGSDEVLSVKRALRDEDEFFERDDGDGFFHIRFALEEFLSVQKLFLSFLVSDDCSRMRAYLRGTAPFLNIEPAIFLKPSNSSEENVLLHAILHLVCLKENEDINKEEIYQNEAMVANQGIRIKGAVSMLSCSIYIMRTLQNSIQAAVEGLIEDGMTGKNNNLHLYSDLADAFQNFWEGFIAPGSGSLAALSLSEDTQTTLDSLRRLIVLSVDGVLAGDENAIPAVAMARLLTSSEISESLHCLCESLLREYTLKVYPKFRRHVFYEWVCKAAKESRFDAPNQSTSSNEYLVDSRFIRLTKGWMNRALRQIELPHGLSLHRPGPSASPTINTDATHSSESPNLFHNADVALVFGTDNGVDATEHQPDLTMGSSDQNESIRRFSCVSLHPGVCDTTNKKIIFPKDIPTIFEKYAVVPPFHERPFQGMLRDQKNCRMSADGWEVSLTNLLIPSGLGGEDNEWLYCVSLVFHKNTNANNEKANVPLMPIHTRKYPSEKEINDECVTELIFSDTGQLDAERIQKSSQPHSSDQSHVFESPLISSSSEKGGGRKMKVSADLKEFNRKLEKQKWSQTSSNSGGATMGIVLISSRNVSSAMRETLSLLYDDFCSIKKSPDNERVNSVPRHFCQPLVDVLGVLSNSQVEGASLPSILEPYLSFSTSQWIHRPLSDQIETFSKECGMRLIESLPPVPLALLFSTILLEQKVVFSSSRRGLLTSASYAIMQLLKPLKWPHLLVPFVPISMMDDLVHYPAPFILGTDERVGFGVLSSLPPDVTLVDLDMGQVILASEFSNGVSSKSPNGETDETDAGALRAQILLLAESLGSIFGSVVYRDSWCIDSPFPGSCSISQQNRNNQKSCFKERDDFLAIQNICNDFIVELLSGIRSCCLWLEEKKRECTGILFDEDRFFHLKNLRAEGLFSPLFTGNKLSKNSNRGMCPLSLDHFDLILETFLRTQCLSTIISTGQKESMLFW